MLHHEQVPGGWSVEPHGTLAHDVVVLGTSDALYDAPDLGTQRARLLYFIGRRAHPPGNLVGDVGRHRNGNVLLLGVSCLGGGARIREEIKVGHRLPSVEKDLVRVRGRGGGRVRGRVRGRGRGKGRGKGRGRGRG